MSENIIIKLELPDNVIGDPQVIKKLREGFNIQWLEDSEEIKENKVTLPSLPIILYSHAHRVIPTDRSGDASNASSSIHQDIKEQNIRYWIHQVFVYNGKYFKKDNKGVIQADEHYLGIIVPVPLKESCQEDSISLSDWFRKYPLDSHAATLLGPGTRQKLLDAVQVGEADSSEKAEFSVKGLSLPEIVPASFHYYNAFSCHYSDSADIYFSYKCLEHSRKVVIK